MFCEKCKNKVVLNVITFTECNECDIDVVSPHLPAYTLCEECAKKLNRCQQCGYLLEDKEV
jgi:hypothetical protein